MRSVPQLLTVAVVVTHGSLHAADRVDYGDVIRPLMAARCFTCHGEDNQEGGLRLDLQAAALAGGDSGVVIRAGDATNSELIRRVVSTDESDRMPPEGARLSASQIASLRDWIDQGAKGIPESAEAESSHWAFRPIVRPKPPIPSRPGWIRNPIDGFVLQELRRRSIEPSPIAPRTTLIRRLYLDLTGLPPAWPRVQSFVRDTRPDAYERLVDELLASPHYGERWGRHWLDLARYADSTGYEADQPREIWLYRDWVIKALNADVPFDQFVTDQLAGDLLPNATIAQRIATGFHCNAMFDGGVRHEAVLDRVNTTGAVFLGLTTGCAQCHSHKTDPLTHREFYQLYAFFNEANMRPMLRDGSFFQPPKVEAGHDPPPKPTTTLVLQHAPQPTHIFIRGDNANLGERVATGLPAFLSTSKADDQQSAKLTRLDLADWLTSADNPLTARVTANRVWQRFFGIGLVTSENDFGRQTPAPLHVSLLDYLARELRGPDAKLSTRGRWRGLKSLHRLIVTSATYRQSSVRRADLADVDPGNSLLARQTRLRLEAELIRDVTLASSDLLSTRLFGPSVYPHQAKGILQNRATPATWTMSEGENRFRRGLYTWVWRLTPHPNLPLFDAPDGVTACTRRDRSNVPVQALTMLNGPSFVEAARQLGKSTAASSSDDSSCACTLVRTCLSRDPNPDELTLIEGLVRERRTAFRENPQEARSVAQLDAPDAANVAAWIVASRVVMNLDEFITRE